MKTPPPPSSGITNPLHDNSYSQLPFPPLLPLPLRFFNMCSCSGRCSTFKSPSDSVCPDFHNFWDQILVVRLFMFTVLCRNDPSHIYFLFSIVFRIFLILFPSPLWLLPIFVVCSYIFYQFFIVEI